MQVGERGGDWEEGEGRGNGGDMVSSVGGWVETAAPNKQPLLSLHTFRRSATEHLITALVLGPSILGRPLQQRKRAGRGGRACNAGQIVFLFF